MGLQSGVGAARAFLRVLWTPKDRVRAVTGHVNLLVTLLLGSEGRHCGPVLVRPTIKNHHLDLACEVQPDSVPQGTKALLNEIKMIFHWRRKRVLDRGSWEQKNIFKRSYVQIRSFCGIGRFVIRATRRMIPRDK